MLTVFIPVNGLLLVAAMQKLAQSQRLLVEARQVSLRALARRR